MFKLESYITPIILNYVEKYVKNIRADQSQVSLWGGDAVFSNLDLRLDVLEQELHLPFSFVSGHIHELQIHVPWTRLHAEPIVVTINTIECVLKLPGCDDRSESADSSSVGSLGGTVVSSSRKDKRKRPVVDTPEAPPGYVQSLVNKIISNISIVCNNLILKYVEEDIVLSLNTRHLRVSSVNELWETAFTELSLPDLILRKMLEITDLTVCLDRRNASGKIETYQEPLLYRCSFAVHCAWIYDSVLSKMPSVSRYEIKCPKLDFSLTDTQLPMLIRISKLILALYYGEIASRNSKRPAETEEIGGHEDDDAAHDEDQAQQGGDSWVGWAWGVGTTVGTAILPIYWEDEDGADLDVPKLDVKRDRVLHFGFYVDMASLVFKLTEQQGDKKSMFGSTKHVFTPFARFDCAGIFQELVVRGMGMVNVSAGISEVSFSPVGTCLCGCIDTKGAVATSSDEVILETPFVQSGDCDTKTYLKGSLFEKDFGCETAQDPKERQRSYQVDWDSHLVEVSEDKMLARTPSFAMDYLYFMSIPDEMTSEELSELGFDLEYSNMDERALCRFVVGPSKINICSGLVHRIQTIIKFCSAYDYAPYAVVESPAGSPQALKGEVQDEVELLLQGSPFRVVQFTAINPSVHIYAADHPILALSRPSFGRSGKRSNPLAIRTASFDTLPSILMKIESIDAQFNQPMYPNRLVSAVISTSLSRDKIPATLTQNCHSNLQCKVNNLSTHLCLLAQSSTLVQCNNVQAGRKAIFFPERFKNDSLRVLSDMHTELGVLKIRITRPQTLAVQAIILSHVSPLPKPARLADTSIMEDSLTRRMSSLVLSISGVRGMIAETSDVRTGEASIENVSVHIGTLEKDSSGVNIQLPLITRPPMLSTPFIGSGLQRSPSKMSPGRAQTKSRRDHVLLHQNIKGTETWLSLCVQYPLLNTSPEEPSPCPPLLVGHMSQLQLCLDPKVFEWVSYSPVIKHGGGGTFSEKTSDEGYREGTRHGAKNKSESETLNRDSKSPSPNVRELKSLNTGSAGRNNSSSALNRMARGGRSAKTEEDTITKQIGAWFPTLNSMLLQWKVESNQVYIPRKSTIGYAGKTVQETIQKANEEHSVQFPTLVVDLPSIQLENVTHKPIIQQFMNSIPIQVPESVWNTKRDNLPWTLKLCDFSIYTLNLSNDWGELNVRECLLEQVSTSCTLGLTVKGNYEDGIVENVAFAVHTDMSPIRFGLSEKQLFLIVEILGDVLKVTMTPTRIPHEFDRMFSRESSPPSQQTAGPDNSKSPLSSPEGSSTGVAAVRPPLEILSDTSTSQQLGDTLDKDLSASPFSLWIQWTVPVISASISTSESCVPVQLKVEMEECQSSFDWTSTFFKMKSRVQAFNVKHFVKRSGEWKVGHNYGVVMSCSDEITQDLHVVNSKGNNIEQLVHSRMFETDSTFFSLTFTRAESANVRRKWKQMLKKSSFEAVNGMESSTESSPRSFVSEIDVKIAPVDIVLSTSTILPFVRMFSHTLSVYPHIIPSSRPSNPQPKKSSPIVGLSINNNTLPLVYFNTKTIRVFVVTDLIAESEDHPVLRPSVLLFTMDSVSISPQVDNPLGRILTRPDLYHSASPLLLLPGSPIEDRQYEAKLKGLGVFTGSWSEVLKKSQKPLKPILISMGENPAFEWNTTKELNDQLLDTEVLLMPCLSKFDLQLTLAPAIVLNTTNPGGKLSSKLIAGHSFEVNATKDIDFHFALSQLNLISIIAVETMESVKLVYSKFTTACKSKFDSGIDCEVNSSQSKMTTTNEANSKDIPMQRSSSKFVPFEALITGSKITCTFFRLTEGMRGATSKDQNMWRKYRYKHRRMEILEEKSQYTEDSDDVIGETKSAELSGKSTKDNMMRPKLSIDHSYDASEEGSVEEQKETIKIYPLLHTGISQPHMFTSCSKHQQKFEISFFDANINLSPTEYFITCGGRRLPEVIDFPTHWVQTKQGDSDPKSGIPPALFTCNVSNFLSSPLNVQVAIDRPLKFDLGADLLKQLNDTGEAIKDACDFGTLINIVTSSSSNSESKSTRQPSKSSSEVIEGAKKVMGHFSSIALKTQQIVVHFPVNGRNAAMSTELVAGLMGTSLKSRFKTKLVKGESTLDGVDFSCSLEKFLTRIGICGIMHNLTGPWNLALKASASWLPHAILPILSVNVDTNLLRVKLGPNHLLAFKVVEETMAAMKREKMERYTDSEPGKTSSFPETILPEESCANYHHSNGEQSYIDDLRAGAFQYVSEEVSENHDPKAYQVVFSKGQNPFMMWKYPQPRTLTRFSIFPVPFVSASDNGMNSSEDIGIHCALQYWDNCLSAFMNYSQFTLSEFQVSHLNLPTVGDRQRCALSDKWRVVLYYEGEDEGGFERVEKNNREIIVTPKSLVSVVRVDSYFNSDIIPKIQASIRIPSLVFDICNHLHFHGKHFPSNIGGNYALNQTLPLDHVVGTIQFDSTMVGMDVWLDETATENFRLQTRSKTTASITYIDYMFLGSHHLLFPAKFQVQLSLTNPEPSSNGKHSKKTLDVNVQSRPIALKFGHYAHHTMNVTTAVWQNLMKDANSIEVLDPNTLKDEHAVLLTHYVISNNSQSPLRFGQADTEENQLLKSGECCMYAWRSPKARLQLRVCVEGGLWRWCDPFEIGGERCITVSVPNSGNTGNMASKTTLIIDVKKISNIQFQVTISGLITIASILSDPLEVRVIMKKKCEQEIEKGSNTVSVEERAVLSSFSATPSFLISSSEVQGVKIRLLGIGTPWSGEIPLKIDSGRKSSVLVRIPTKEKGQCLTIWSRLVKEMYGSESRTLLLFSPMYMARSLLPNPMKVIVSVPQTPTLPATEIIIPGRDVPVQLETRAPSDKKSNLAFKVVESLPPSDPVSISWGLIEQVRVQKTEKEIINEILFDLTKFGPQGCETKWPFHCPEDLSFPVSAWKPSDQPKTDVQVNFTQFHPECNTLCVEINPWCLIVNRLGLPLILKEGGSVKGKAEGFFEIGHDSVLVPPMLTSTFYLGLSDGENSTSFSPPLQLSDQEWRFRQLMPSVHGIIPKEGIAQTKIILDGQVCFLTIRSRNEKGMRVIHILPTFCISNKLDRKLGCAPISVIKPKQRIDAATLDLISMELDGSDERNGILGSECVPLLLWQVVGEPAKDQLFDGFQYVSLSIEDTDWALPLNLEDSRSIEIDRRRAVFLPKRKTEEGKADNIPLLVTVHQKSGQIYIIVADEKEPSIVVHNNLPVALKYGQSTRNFGQGVVDDWFYKEDFQLVRSNRHCYYSFPWIDQNFPFKEEVLDLPQLVLTSKVEVKDEEKEWEFVDNGHTWSKTIDISIHNDIFLNLPSYGDIKVIVERVANTAHVFIDPVSKIEFSAKDIRNRIPASPDLNASTEVTSGAEESFATVNSGSFVVNDAEMTLTSGDEEQSFVSVRPTSTMSQAPTRFHSMVEEPERKPQRAIMDIFISVFLDELSLALSDDCRESAVERDEYLRVTLDQILVTSHPELKYMRGLMRSTNGSVPRESKVTVAVGSMQIDNQMFRRRPFDFATVLFGQIERKNIKMRLHTTPTTMETEEIANNSLLVLKFQFDSNNAEKSVLKRISVKSKPLAINIEDKLLFRLSEILNTFKGIPNGNKSISDVDPMGCFLPQEVEVSSRNIAHKLCLEEVCVESVDVSVSVHASIKMYIGLDQSPLNFTQFRRSHLLTTSYSLGQMLARHYISGALFRAGWVVGSLDLIGSPAGLTRTVGDGLKDFVMLPYEGILMGPWAFLGGMANGSTSLMKHVSAGTLTSMTNFATSVSRNLDRLSFDPEHCQRNEIFRREKPQGFGQGLVNGLSGVGISLLGAIGGIAHHPLSALMQEQASPSGVVSGLTRGLVGVVTKPLGGAAEFVAQTGHGLLHGTGWTRDQRPRYPAMPDHICTFLPSDLKFAWKFLKSCNLRETNLLSTADVLLAKTMVPITLLLTSKVVVIISSDEDAEDSMHCLEDLDCVECPNDPTQFSLVPRAKPEKIRGEKSDHWEQEKSVKDRVAQFVMDTTGMSCIVSDVEESEPEMIGKTTDDSKKKPEDSVSPEMAFVASPVIRESFCGTFVIARRQLCQKGFDIL